ncbi:aldose reductase-like [Platysternon megacephalum]|uniref:Aldose reductase-like n=1 Tax=Platysternon megacephalum TaxID=55544 RepID=A0A4D9DZZ5_9SAUR|nr:aldose reductase-like [Platysternon megacephalum]
MSVETMEMPLPSKTGLYSYGKPEGASAAKQNSAESSQDPEIYLYLPWSLEAWQKIPAGGFGHVSFFPGKLEWEDRDRCRALPEKQTPSLGFSCAARGFWFASQMH